MAIAVLPEAVGPQTTQMVFNPVEFCSDETKNPA
jgi:hypothetical protein